MGLSQTEDAYRSLERVEEIDSLVLERWKSRHEGRFEERMGWGWRALLRGYEAGERFVAAGACSLTGSAMPSVLARAVRN